MANPAHTRYTIVSRISLRHSLCVILVGYPVTRILLETTMTYQCFKSHFEQRILGNVHQVHMLIVKRVYVSQDTEHNVVNKAPLLLNRRESACQAWGSNCVPVSKRVRFQTVVGVDTHHVRPYPGGVCGRDVSEIEKCEIDQNLTDRMLHQAC